MRRILEIGCGTGLLTRDIQARWPDAEIIVTDLSPGMLDKAAAGGLVAGTLQPATREGFRACRPRGFVDRSVDAPPCSCNCNAIGSYQSPVAARL